jgi:hypothetical protein
VRRWDSREGEFGNSRAARANGTSVWAWNSRFEQLAHRERDWAAHTTALGPADAAKWVHRPKYCAAQSAKTSRHKCDSLRAVHRGICPISCGLSSMKKKGKVLVPISARRTDGKK